MKLIKKIINRLFGKKWICEYCADIVYCKTRPYCKACCHVHGRDVKMFRIKR